MPGFSNRVLIVDDHVDNISWLISFLEFRQYEIEVVTNEGAARAKLEAVQEGRDHFAQAIVDIMVPVKGIMELVEFDEEFYQASNESGVRICRYARQDLMLDEEKLPIVCISGREDEALREALDDMGIRLFPRVSMPSEESLRDFLVENLPRL